MKPIQVFIFVISVIAGLGIIMLTFPEDGIKITDNFSLQFVTPNELFSEEESSVDVDSLLDHQIDIDTLDKLLNEKDSTKKLDIEELKKLINRLEYPDDDSTILWTFFEKLDSIQQLGKVRIIHYGDSQIEGDRITSFLRYKLQNKFP